MNTKPTDRSNRIGHDVTSTPGSAVKDPDAPVSLKEAIGERPQRKPLNRRDVLKFQQRDGYVRRIVNDVEDGLRIKQYQEWGWSIVQTPTKGTAAGEGAQMGSAITRSVGGGRIGVLMEIPEQWYKEYQDEKQADVATSERSLFEKPDLDHGKLEIQRK